MGGRVLRALLAVALVVGGAVALLAGPAGAITSVCQTGSAGATPDAQANFKANCSLDASISSSRQVIHDYPFARYHFGAARPVTVTATATGVLTAQTGSTFVTGAGGDLNHTVTASGNDQTCLNLPAKGAFLKVVTSATSATLQTATGMKATAAAGSKTVTITSGSAAVIATGTTVFSSCDVGRTISGTGIPAGAKVKTFVNTKLVEMTAAATATAANSSRSFGAQTRVVKVDNTPDRAITGMTLTNGSTAVTGPANFNAGTDVGRPITGTCIPAGATIASVATATSATLSAAATCTTGSRTVNVNVTTGSSVYSGAPAGSFQGGDQFRGVSGTCLTGTGVTVGTVDSDTQITGTSSVAGNSNANTTGACTLTLAALPALGNLSINAGNASTARLVTDATCVSGKIVSTAAAWDPTDKNLLVTGTGVTPANMRITAVTGTQATVTPTCTFTGTKIAQIGTPTDTAPGNGDMVAQLVTNIQLKPTLVDGSAPCNAAEYTGTTIAASWANVGSYKAGSSLGLATTDYPKSTIAQLLFPTSVVTFAGYIAPRAAASVDETGHVDPDTAAHPDIVLPNLPTTLAICPGTSVGSGYTVIGQSLTPQQAKTGLGQPSTAIVRGNGPTAGTGHAYITLGSGGGATDLDGGSCTTSSTVSFANLGGFGCGTP